MISCRDLRNILRKPYAELDKPSAEVCCEIIFFLSRHSSSELNHITYQTIMNGIRPNTASKFHDNEELIVSMMRSMDYLTSSKLKLLEINFQYYGPNDEEPTELDKDDLAQAIVEGKFYHPESGDEIKDFRKYIFPYFSPSEKWVLVNG